MKEALLVIDVQNVYTDESSELFVKNNSAVIKNINKLIELFRTQKAPIVFVKHQHKKDLSDLGRMFDFAGEASEAGFIEGEKLTDYDIRIKVEKGDCEIIKTRYCAFGKTNLDKVLKNKGIQKVVICGFMTNFCCETAARTAHGLDYYVDFIIDATGTPGTESLGPIATVKATAVTFSNGFAVIKKTADKIVE